MTTISFPSKYVPDQLTNNDTKKQLKMLLNPYSVLTPPGGVLGFLKIKHSTDIFLFIACKIRKYLILYKKQEI